MTIKKTLIIGLLLIASSKIIWAHPDGATPFWYSSSFIFGFVGSCAGTLEREGSPITRQLWPEEIQSVCSCVVDSLRHSLTYQESIEENKVAMQLIVNATMPVCIEEQILRKGDESVRVQPDGSSD